MKRDYEVSENGHERTANFSGMSVYPCPGDGGYFSLKTWRIEVMLTA
jgi:hypothetical protein